MPDQSFTLFCISCGEKFQSNLPDAALCPNCGSAPEAALLDLTQADLTPAPSPFRRWESAAWQVGDLILDTYEVRQIFTSGGMGLVYRVHHRGWGIDLALKSPRPEIFSRPGGKENFVREAETWVDLGLHPHIVSCYYVRSVDEIPRVFAEFVEGGSLKDWIEDRRLYEGGKEAALERILDIAIQFAWGLAYAHEKGLVHQDVKPANVLMMVDEADEDHPIAKVSDFGLAKARALAGEATGAEGQGSILVSSGGCTPAYCSPEQARKEPVSCKTDIWSWAVSVLEMFTGEVTWYSGAAAGEVLEEYLAGEGGESGMPMPAELSEILKACFQRQPAQRPDSMAEIAGRLEAIYRDQIGKPYPRQAPRPVELRADSLNNKAVSLLDLSRMREAQQAFGQALEADPKHLEADYNLSLLRWRASELSDLEFVKGLEAQQAANPEDWRPNYYLSLAHLERDDCTLALLALERVRLEHHEIPEIKMAQKLAQRRLPASMEKVREFHDHEGPLRALCLSPDGRLVLSGGKGIVLWEFASGEILDYLDRESAVESLVYSKDGQRLLSAGHSNICLWDVQTRQCLKNIKIQSRINSAAFYSGIRYAITGAKDQAVTVWDLDTGQSVRTLQGHQDGVQVVSVSPDSRLVASGSLDNTIRLWDPASGDCLGILEGHEAGIFSLAWNSTGELLASQGGKDNLIRIWDVGKRACVRILSGCSQTSSVHFYQQDQYVLSGLTLWELDSGQCLHAVQYNVSKLVVCPDGMQILTGDDYHERVNPRSSQGVQTRHVLSVWRGFYGGRGIPRAPFVLTRIHTSAQGSDRQASFQRLQEKGSQALERGREVEAASLARQARALPGFERHPDILKTWQALYTLLPRTTCSGGWEIDRIGLEVKTRQPIQLVGDRLQAVLADNRRVLLWDFLKHQFTHTFDEGIYTRSISIGDDRMLLTAGYDKNFRSWELATGKHLQTFTGHEKYVYSAAFSPDMKWAVSISEDLTMRIWDASSGYCLRIIPIEYSDQELVLSPDGKYIATMGAAHSPVRILDFSTGATMHTFKEPDSVTSIDFSENARTLMLVCGKTIQWKDVLTGETIYSFARSDDFMAHLGIKTVGRFALTGSHNGLLRLWNLAQGECMCTFGRHSSGVQSVALSKDGRHAVSYGDDQSLRLWFLDWELDPKEPADWDAGALPYLDVFLSLHTPYAGTLPKNRTATEEEITLALTRRGKPTWTEQDFHKLLYTLGCAGYGWLRPEGVRQKLVEMAGKRG